MELFDDYSAKDILAHVWLRIWPYHEREHAVDLRLALRLPNLPKRLLHL